MSHRLVVLISGSGTNLQAIIDAIDRSELDARIELVISNREGATGLTRAEQAGIDTRVLPHRAYPTREAFDLDLLAAIDERQPDTVVLAGFMRILTDTFVHHFQGRLLNVHPSLLPRYPGLHTHRQALAAGDREHGCSIHFVTDELDGGPVVARAPVPVFKNDTEESLSKRVQSREHVLYPLVLSWRAAGRLKLAEEGVLLDGKRLPQEGYYLDWPAGVPGASVRIS